MFLEMSGFEVIGIADNGQRAIDLYKAFSVKPDIILMDYRMPIKNGLETTEELLQINGVSKIIFLSADRSIKEVALKAGAVAFLQKPYSLDKLISEIKSFL